MEFGKMLNVWPCNKYREDRNRDIDIMMETLHILEIKFCVIFSNFYDLMFQERRVKICRFNNFGVT